MPTMTSETQATETPNLIGTEKENGKGTENETGKVVHARWLARGIAGLVLLAAGAAGARFWLDSRHYESTDDAQIDGHLNPISARVSGHVEKLLVEDNQYVQAGTPLVQIDPRAIWQQTASRCGCAASPTSSGRQARACTCARSPTPRSTLRAASFSA